MLTVILAIVASLFFPTIMIPAALVAWVTPLTLWPTAAVLLALYVITDTILD